jgi:hypothetical protein
MYPEQISALAVVRALCGIVGAILLTIGGHHLRALGDPTADALGLVAYGLGLVAIAVAIPVAFTAQTKDGLSAGVSPKTADATGETDGER